MERLEDLRIFVQVAQLSSFTQAALALALPKASVSFAVARLEDAVGARLLQRTTRRVQLTQEGAAFLERCNDLIADAEETYGMFRSGAAALVGRVRVDMPVAIARDVVMPRLADFLTKYPLVTVELGSTERRVDLIVEGYDCVVRVGAVVATELIARPLGRFTVVSCASPAYLGRLGLPRRTEDLAPRGHRLVHFASVLGTSRDSFEYMDGDDCHYVPLPGVLTVNNAEAYVAGCLAGIGIIQTPLVTVEAHLRAGSLVEVLPDHRPGPMPVSLLYPHRRNLARRVRVFMDWLDGILRAHVR